MATAPQQPGAAGGLPQQGLTPDQLQKMKVMAKQAMTLLTEGTNAEQIVEQAKAGDPQQVIATMVVNLLERLYEAATEAGQQVDMVTLLVTGIQIIGDITELLVAGDVLPPGQEQQFIAAVSKMAVDQHNANLQQGGQPGAQA